MADLNAIQRFDLRKQALLESQDDYDEGEKRANKAFTNIENRIGNNRDELTKVYDDYASRTANSTTLSDYYANRLVLEKAATKLGENTIFDQIGDFAQGVYTGATGGMAKILEGIRETGDAIGSISNMNPSKLYKVATGRADAKTKIESGLTYLNARHAQFPENDDITELYNLVNNGFDKDPGEYEGVAQIYSLVNKINDFTNALDVKLFQDKYTQDEYEAQRLQQLKTNLSYESDIAKGIQTGGQILGEQVPGVLVANVAGGIANNLRNAVGLSKLSTAGKVGALTMLGLEAKGGAYREAISEGANFSQANAYSDQAAMAEVLSEVFGGESVNAFLGLGINLTPAGKAVKDALDGLGIKNKWIRAIINVGGELTAEAWEEVFTGLVDPIFKEATYGKKVDWENMPKELLSEFVDSLIPTAMMMGLGRPQINLYIDNATKDLNTRVLNSTDITDADKIRITAELNNLARDAKRMIEDDFDGTLAKVESEFNQKVEDNNALKKKALDLINRVESNQNLTDEQKEAYNQRVLNNSGIINNTNRMTRQEATDLGKTSNVQYANTEQVNNATANEGATVKQELNGVQRAVKDLFDRVTGGQIVYTENPVGVYGFTNNDGNFYVDGNQNTTNTMRAATHEIGHMATEKDPTLMDDFNKKARPTVQQINAYMYAVGNLGMTPAEAKAEMLSDVIAYIATKQKNLSRFEDSTRNALEKIGELFFGTEKSSRPSNYALGNADYQKIELYVSPEILNDAEFENKVVEALLSLKDGQQTQKVLDKGKKITKEASKTKETNKETPKTDKEKAYARIEEKYKKMRGGKSPEAIKKMIADELNLKYNGPKDNSSDANEVRRVYQDLKDHSGTLFSAKKYNNQYPKNQNLIGYDFEDMTPAKYSNKISGKLKTNNDYPNVGFFGDERQIVVSKINTKFKKLPNGSTRSITTWTPYDGERTYYFIKNKFNDYTFTLKFSRRVNNEQTTNEGIYDGTSQYGGGPNRQYNKADGQRQDNQRNVGLDRNSKATNTRGNTAESNRTLFDNKGNKLTKEQVEFFRRSVVRDKNGNLLVLYHGSAEDFTVFDKNKIRIYDYDAFFNGFWFSTDEDTMPAFMPANYRKAVYLNITNPAPNNVWHKVAKEVEREMLEHDKETDNNDTFPKTFDKSSRSEHDEVRLRLQSMGYDGIHWDGEPNVDWQELEEKGKTTFKSVRGLGTYTLVKNEEDGGIDLLDKYGEVITGFTDQEDFLEIQEEVWVAFEPNQIKLTTNENPTENSDIRYSIRKGESNTEKIINNQRNELAKQQDKADRLEAENKGLKKINKGIKSTGRQRIRELKRESDKMLKVGRNTELKLKEQLEREGKKYNRLSELAVDLKYETQLDRKAQADGIKYGREYKDLFIGLRREGKSITEAYNFTKEIYEASQELNNSIDSSMKILNDIRKKKVYNKLPKELKAKIDSYEQIWTGSRKQADLMLARRILDSATAKEYLGKVALSKAVRNKIMNLEGDDFEGKGTISLEPLFNGSIGLAKSFEQGLIDLQNEIKEFQSTNKQKERTIELSDDIADIQVAVEDEAKKQGKSKLKGLKKNVLGTNKTLVNSLMTLKTEIQALMGGNIHTPVMKIQDNLQKGETRKKQSITEVYRILNTFMEKSKGINRVIGTQTWNKSLENSLSNKAKFTDTGMSSTGDNGKSVDIKLPRHMMMSLAMHLANDDNMLHISGGIVGISTDENGNTRISPIKGMGVRIPDETLYRRGQIKDAYDAGVTVKLTQEQVEKIVDMLTPEELAFVDATKEVFKYTTSLINEVSNRIVGYDMATVENYFPIRVWDKGGSSGAVLNAPFQKRYGDALAYMLSPGWLQERTTSTNPIYLENITDVMNRVVNNVTNFYGYAEALRDNHIILDSTMGNGTELNKNIDTLSSSFMPNYTRLTRFITGQESLRDGRFRGLMAMNTLTFNVGTWLTQPMSFFNAMKYFSTKEFMTSINPINNNVKLNNMIRNYFKEIGIDSNEYSDHELARAFIAMATPNLDYRAIGYKTPAINQLFNKSLQQKIGAHGIELFDDIAVTALARMMAYSVSLDENIEFGSEKYFEELGNRLTEVLVETQPEFSQINRANMFRSTSPILRTLSLFGTPANQMFNNFAQSAMQVRYEAREGKISNEAKVSLAKSISGIIISSAMVGLVRALRDSIRDDEDKDDFRDRWAAQTIVALLGPTLILDDVAQFIMSTAKFGGMNSYDFNTPETTFMNGITNLAEKLMQLGKEDVSAVKKTTDIIKAMGVITPIDTKSVVRVFEALMKFVAPDLYQAYALQNSSAAYKAWLKNSDTPMSEFYKAYTATRQGELDKLGYHKADKSKGIESNLKETRRKAL